MTVAEICVSVYLMVGILAATTIWSALAASKRRFNRAKPANYQMKYSPLREPNTKPSRLHS